MIPFVAFPSQDSYRDELVDAFARVVDSKWYVLGPELAAFEQEYARTTSAEHCVGVASGLDALIIALRVLGIGAGDEVLVPSNTYIATWLAVSAVGATPVPVEPNADTMNLDAARIDAAVTARTTAVMPVHLYGQPCDMTAVRGAADRHGLAIVEDNAQAQLATWEGRFTGTFGAVNGTSFYPTKNLGALGDAGAVTTDDPALAEQAAIYRNYGSPRKYVNELRGMNSRLDEVQAALLRVKLARLAADTQARRDIAASYSHLLEGCPNLTTPRTATGAEHVYHLYVVRTEQRDELQQHLTDNGVQTLIHYPIPPHLQQAYSDLGYGPGDFPIAERLARECLSLPLYPGLDAADVQRVAALIRSFCDG